MADLPDTSEGIAFVQPADAVIADGQTVTVDF
jgi:hypothetical protein